MYRMSLLTVLLIPSLVLAQPKAEGKKYALLVGVQRYSDATKLRNLNYTEKDVTDLGELLTKQGYRVTIMTRTEAIKQDKDFLRPTAKNIHGYLERMTKDCKLDDTILVGFTGHGVHLKKSDKLYFCPQETDLTDEKSLLAIDDVLNYFKYDDKARMGCLAKNKILVMDACRNDPADGATTGKPNELDSLTRPLVPDPPGGTVAIFSCSKGQISHESNKHNRGFLFHHLIEGLGGKAANKKGEVTMLDLAKYVTEEVPESVKSEKGPKIVQTPEIKGEIRAMILAETGNTGSATDEFTEEYEWKGVKKTRTVRKVNLGGEMVEFVKIPAGSFDMGSPDSDKDADKYKDEKPQHKVMFTKALWVAKYPVTKGQFAAFTKAANVKTEAESDDKGGWGYDGKEFKQSKDYSCKSTGWPQTESHPVVNVTWNDADAYCKWAAKESKLSIRLMNESEYEYANRGGSKTIYFTGDDISSMEGYANVSDKSAKAKFDFFTAAPFDDGYVFTSPVGKFKPNGFGLYDMTGNVYSWCGDWYDAKLYERGSVTNPKANTNGEQKYRILRGDSWGSDPESCRAAIRFNIAPDFRNFNSGFRLCLD